MLADGFSCRTQLAVGRTGREGWHLAQFLLVTSYVGGSLAAGLITVFIAGLFGLLWFAFPLARRH